MYVVQSGRLSVFMFDMVGAGTDTAGSLLPKAPPCAVIPLCCNPLMVHCIATPVCARGVFPSHPNPPCPLRAPSQTAVPHYCYCVKWCSCTAPTCTVCTYAVPILPSLYLLAPKAVMFENEYISHFVLYVLCRRLYCFASFPYLCAGWQ